MVELRKVNGLLVMVDRCNNDRNGNPRYEIVIFKDMGEYTHNCNYLLPKVNSKGKHVVSTYDLNSHLEKLTECVNVNFS